jgi:hypothetical protein
MTKKKKNRQERKNHQQEGKKHREDDDSHYVMGVIKSLGPEPSLKKLFPKILKKMSQEEVVLALIELEKRGQIAMQQKGIIRLTEEVKPVHKKARHEDYLIGCLCPKEVCRQCDAGRRGKTPHHGLR